MTRPLRWLRRFLSLRAWKQAVHRAFYGKRPRRPRCACTHAWCDHDAKGCQWCRQEGLSQSGKPCNYRRNGTPVRRVLTVVKESA